MSAMVYDSFLTGFAQRSIDWVQDNFKVVLVTGDYQPDTLAHRTRSDLGGFELGTSSGYERGGMRLRGRQIEQNEPNGVMLAASDVTWDGFTGDFRYAVVCQDNGNRSQDLLVSVADMGDQHVENARVMLAYSADGVCLFAPEED
jgi:hypothetical protein